MSSEEGTTRDWESRRSKIATPQRCGEKERERGGGDETTERERQRGRLVSNEMVAHRRTK